jgi:hypothetical protein
MDELRMRITAAAPSLRAALFFVSTSSEARIIGATHHPLNPLHNV